MAITIHAIAADRSHGESILSQLSSSGFSRSTVRMVPVGIHRLVRKSTLLYRAFDSRPLIGTVLALGALGAALGVGCGLYIIMLPAAHPLTVFQGMFIVIGAVPVGGGIGLLLGLFGGLVIAGIAKQFHGTKRTDESVMLAVEAESLTSAKAVETILNANGAREIRIAQYDR